MIRILHFFPSRFHQAHFVCLMFLLGCRSDNDPQIEADDNSIYSHAEVKTPYVASRDPDNQEIENLLYATLKSTRSWDSGVNNKNARLVFSILSKDDLELAISLISQPIEIPLKLQAIRGIMDGWMPRDPVGCFEWMNSIGLNSNQLGSLSRGVVDVASKDLRDGGDPELWIQLAKDPQFENSFSKMILNEVAFQFGHDHEIKEGLNRFQSLVGDDNLGLTVNYFKGCISRDPVSVVKFLDDLDDADYSLLRPLLSVQLAAEWSSSDPESAFNWIADLPPQEAAKAMPSVIVRWLSVDSSGTSQAVEKLKPGIARDSAIEAMGIWLIDHGSIEDARMWMPEVDDKSIRENLEGIMNDAILNR